jgi:hypothetical protein
MKALAAPWAGVAGGAMKPWRVVSKECRRIDADSVELHLHVERDGVNRDAIVSGFTFDRTAVGDDVPLSDVR